RVAGARLSVVLSEDRPSAPRNVRAETISSSAILLAWERPQYNAGKVIAYSVHYTKAQGERALLHAQERASHTGTRITRRNMHHTHIHTHPYRHPYSHHTHTPTC